MAEITRTGTIKFFSMNDNLVADADAVSLDIKKFILTMNASPDAQTAAEVSVTSAGFNGNLAPTDNEVQKCLQKLDDLVVLPSMTAHSGEFLTNNGASSSWAATEKSLWEYIADFDLTNPPAYGFNFLIISKNQITDAAVGSHDTFAPTLTNNGNYIVKRYNAAGTVDETITRYSAAINSLDPYTSSGTVTPYGIITKYSIEPSDTLKPITTLNLTGKVSLLAIEFGASYWAGFTTLSGAFNACSSLSKVNFPTALNSITTMATCFKDCKSLQQVQMPTSMSAVTSFANAFENCYLLQSLTMPTTVGTVTTLASMCANCYSLTSLMMTASLNDVTTMASMCANCYSLTTITLPTSITGITTLESAFSGCLKLTSLTFPASMDALTTMASMCSSNSSLVTVTLPTSMTSLDTYTSTFSGCNALTSISKCTGYAAGQVAATTHGVNLFSMTAYDQPFKASKVDIKGTSATILNTLTSIEIDWANSTFGGAAPQIDLRWNALISTEIDRIFTALPTAAKTINVAGNPGAATCTQTIATDKTWTVIVA